MADLVSDVFYPRELDPPPRGLPEGWVAIERQYGETSAMAGKTYLRFQTKDGRHARTSSILKAIEIDCNEKGVDPAEMLTRYGEERNLKKQILKTAVVDEAGQTTGDGYPREIIPPPAGLPEGWRAIECKYGDNSTKAGTTYTRFQTLDGRHTRTSSILKAIEIDCEEKGIDSAPAIARYQELKLEKKSEKRASGFVALEGDERDAAIQNFRDTFGPLSGAIVMQFRGWSTRFTHILAERGGQDRMAYIEPDGKEWTRLNKLESVLQDRMDKGEGGDIAGMINEAIAKTDVEMSQRCKREARETGEPVMYRAGAEAPVPIDSFLAPSSEDKALSPVPASATGEKASKEEIGNSVAQSEKSLPEASFKAGDAVRVSVSFESGGDKLKRGLQGTVQSCKDDGSILVNFAKIPDHPVMVKPPNFNFLLQEAQTPSAEQPKKRKSDKFSADEEAQASSAVQQKKPKRDRSSTEKVEVPSPPPEDKRKRSKATANDEDTGKKVKKMEKALAKAIQEKEFLKADKLQKKIRELQVTQPSSESSASSKASSKCDESDSKCDESDSSGGSSSGEPPAAESVNAKDMVTTVHGKHVKLQAGNCPNDLSAPPFEVMSVSSDQTKIRVRDRPVCSACRHGWLSLTEVRLAPAGARETYEKRPRTR